jgi:NAD-dependent DNA ligase
MSTSFENLKNMGTNIKIVRHVVIKEDELNYDYLSKKLIEFRQSSEYDIDGIVICNDSVHKIVAGKNPKYAFAFKTIFTQEQVEVIVTDVEWNISKHRLIKPIVKFEEIILNNVKIKQATGFNASYIINNKIGPGSHLIIIRSGDVIPHILKVLTESSSGMPKMPDIPYKWSSDKEVDIILLDEKKNKEQDIQSFIHFASSLNMEGIKKGVITKLYDSGLDTLYKIIHVTYEELIKIEGFKDKSAKNLINTIQSTLSNISCDKLLYAFNIFGRNLGDKKLKLITDKFPFIMTNREKALNINITELMSIEGIADISAKQFIDNLPLFYKMYEESGINCKKDSASASPTKPASPSKMISFFNNKKVVFTGFRNKDYEKIIELNNGKIMGTISKNTDLLIVKDISEKNEKVKKATELNIQIITKADLEKIITSGVKDSPASPIPVKPASPTPVKPASPIPVKPASPNIKLNFFNNKKVVFTGFRNKDYEKIIESNNGKIMGNISKNTDLLVIKDNDEINEKIKKARNMNIQVMTKEELEKIIL